MNKIKALPIIVASFFAFMLPIFFVADVAASPTHSMAPATFAVNYQGTCDDANTLTAENCSVIAYVVTAINVLSGLVGITVVLMIGWGGIQYAWSRDNPQQAAAAKERIRNAVIALICYLFIFAFLNWLVPGGVL